MSNPAPGWYEDPSGLPGMFRWWDGATWTVELTSDPSLPPGGGVAGGATSSSVPPPPGAPGPSYRPPGWQPTSAGPAEVLSSHDEPTGQNRKPYLILAGALTAVIAIAALVLILSEPSDEPGTAAGSTSSPTPEQPPEPTPEQPSPPEAEPSPEQSEPPAPPPEATELPRLEFDPLGGDWQETELGDLLPRGLGQFQITEPDYSDGRSWRALLATGYPPPEVVSDPSTDLKTQAESIAEWFAERGFTTAQNLSVEPGDASPIEVDGHEAYRMKLRFTFEVEGLQAESEEVTIVVVDLGEELPAGLFLASIPDTHEQLEDDVDRAIDSLRVVE